MGLTLDAWLAAEEKAQALWRELWRLRAHGLSEAVAVELWRNKAHDLVAQLGAATPRDLKALNDLHDLHDLTTHPTRKATPMQTFPPDPKAPVRDCPNPSALVHRDVLDTVTRQRDRWQFLAAMPPEAQAELRAVVDEVLEWANARAESGRSSMPISLENAAVLAGVASAVLTIVAANADGNPPKADGYQIPTPHDLTKIRPKDLQG